MEVHLVAESLKFMVLGMGIVFIFLYVLILLMQFQAWIINRYFSQNKKSHKESKTASSVDSDDELAKVAVIVSAIAQYNKDKS